MKANIIAVACYVVAVAAHGKITSPQPRGPGPAMAEACGNVAVEAVKTQDTIPLEDIRPASNNCKLNLCRGATFEDNEDLLQTFTPGQVIDFKAVIPIPHEGPCNVSVVDTASNQLIGDPLIEFDSYADENLPQLPANNTAFSVTMPQLKAGQCTKAGECVIQWFWFGAKAQQTYESCVDFVVG